MANTYYDSISLVYAPNEPIYPNNMQFAGESLDPSYYFGVVAYKGGSRVSRFKWLDIQFKTDYGGSWYSRGEDTFELLIYDVKNIPFGRDLTWIITGRPSFDENIGNQGDFRFEGKTHSVGYPSADMIPASGWVNPKNGELKITPQYEAATMKDDDGKLDIFYNLLFVTAVLLRWRPAGTTAWQSHAWDFSGQSKKFDQQPLNFAPPGLLEKTNYEWEIVVTANDGEFSKPPTSGTFTTSDSLSTATAISPLNAYVEAGVANTFTWRHTIDTGTLPSKSELQYSLDQITWLALRTVTGSATRADFPADTLPVGRLWWRCRTFNTDGAGGAWSEPAAFVARGAPPPPSISSISNEPRPVIRWQSSGQAAFQVRLYDGAGAVVDDTGEAYGAGKAYAPNSYLSNGAYTIEVRVKASNGMWSRWSQSSLMLSAIPPPVPQAAYERVDGGVRVTVENAEQFAALYLLRNGRPVARLGRTYTDYAAEPSQYYFVRGVNTADCFADSPAALVAAPVARGVRIAPVSEPSNLFTLLVRRGEPASLGGNTELPGASARYAGREYPVYYFSTFSEQSFSIEFFLRERAKYHELLALARRRETMLYRDTYGEKFYVALTSISDARDHIGVVFTLTMQRVDYQEQIRYDEKVVG